MREPLAADTPPDVEARQIERWRGMSPAEKVALVESMSQTVRDLAMAGLKRRYPNAAARELFLRMAMLTLGADLALVAYPEIATLDVDGK